MSLDDGGPAFSGDRIVAWYVPGVMSKMQIELLKATLEEVGIKVPVIIDSGKEEVSTEKESYQGASLRDIFAGMAMRSLVSDIKHWNEESAYSREQVAEEAYALADAMIARKRETEKQGG